MMEYDEDLIYDSDEGSNELTVLLASLGIDENAELSDDDAGEDEKEAKDVVMAPVHAGGDAEEGFSSQARQAGKSAPLAPAVPSAVPLAAQEMMDKPLCAKRPSLEAARQGKRRRSAGRRTWTVRQAAQWACQELQEKKYILMCQVFYTLRLKKAKALVLATKKVERNGGMMTADGQRRRTAGGTFFCLLKDAVSPDIFKSICAHDARCKKKKLRQKSQKSREQEKRDNLLRALQIAKSESTLLG